MFTIAIVDEVEEQARLLAAYLPRAEFRTVSVCDPPTFLERVEEISPDAILLDLPKSGPAGFDILREMRGRLPIHVPIYVVTSAGSDAEAIAAGANGTIAKPIDRAELLELIRSALGDPSTDE